MVHPRKQLVFIKLTNDPTLPLVAKQALLSLLARGPEKAGVAVETDSRRFSPSNDQKRINLAAR